MITDWANIKYLEKHFLKDTSVNELKHIAKQISKHDNHSSLGFPFNVSSNKKKINE